MPTTLYDPTEIEYLDGRPYPKVSPKRTHGRVQFKIAAAIAAAARERGEVVSEVRFDPGAIDGSKTELIPDVAFTSWERLAQLSGADEEKPPFSPDVAVEIRSPSDDLRYLTKKIARYLATGSLLVLDVDPAMWRIDAYASDGVRRFSRGETFSHPAVPWLTFDLDLVFARPKFGTETNSE